MSNEFKYLLSPFDLHGLALKNRVVLAPMTRSRAGEEQLANELMAKYYVQRASAGLLITEGTFISPEGIGWLHVPGIFAEEHARAWQTVTSKVHEAGGIIFCQLWHCGRASHSSFQKGKLPVAPSAIKLEGDTIHAPAGKVPYEVPHALTLAEIKKTVADYVNAASRAKAAGFDGIELHSANGYLLDEFLQSKTNHREDEYGGSIENRSRLLLEVVDAVSTIWPSNRVGVRLAPNGVYNDMGSPDFREQFLYTAEQLDKKKVSYLHILDGLAFGFHKLGEPMTLSEFRKVFNGTLMGNCGYTPETAETSITEGHADLVSFGRPYISNPDLVERLRHGWPLSPDAEMKDWYAFGPEGYADFPTHEEAVALRR